MSNFIDKCLRGEALLEDIDDYIDEWHDSSSNDPLYKYLGMTKSEYAHWVEDSDNLPFIISAHKFNISYDEAIAVAATMAARSNTVSNMSQIKDWLNTQGLDV